MEVKCHSATIFSIETLIIMCAVSEKVAAKLSPSLL